MKKKFLIISLAMSGFAVSQSLSVDTVLSKYIAAPDTNQVDTVTVPTQKQAKKTSVQCNGTSKSTGNQCKLRTRHESTFCHHHRD
jgi:hypothetical protein